VDAYGYVTTISGVCDSESFSAHFLGILVYHTSVGATLSRQLSRSPTPQLAWRAEVDTYVLSLCGKPKSKPIKA
jgi:hypothetical protein